MKKSILAIALVILIGVGTLIIVSHLPKQNTETVQQTNELDIASEIVQKLHSYVKFNYFMPEGDAFCIEDSNWKVIKEIKPGQVSSYPELFYREYVDVSNLSDDLKILAACSALYSEKTYTIQKVELVENIADENIYVFSVDDIKNKAKEMFNTTVNIVGNSYRWTSYGLMYNSSSNAYKYIQYVSGGGTDYADRFKIVKAEQNDNEIYIYDNYIREIWNLSGNNEVSVFATSDQNIKILEDTSEKYKSDYFEYLSEIGNTLPIYKHTFRKADNGSYYWVSTELTNKFELNIIEQNFESIQPVEEFDISAEKKYVEISDNLNRDDLFFVTNVITNRDDTYTLKGVIYTRYVFTQAELDELVKKGTFTYFNQYGYEPRYVDYTVKKNDSYDTYEFLGKFDGEDRVEFRAHKKADEKGFVPSKDDDGTNTYYFYNQTENGEEWKLTEEYRKITIPGNIVIEDWDGYTKLAKDYFNNSEGTSKYDYLFGYDFENNLEARDTGHPSPVYDPIFVNGKCSKIYLGRTGY